MSIANCGLTAFFLSFFKNVLIIHCFLERKTEREFFKTIKTPGAVVLLFRSVERGSPSPHRPDVVERGSAARGRIGLFSRVTSKVKRAKNSSGKA